MNFFEEGNYVIIHGGRHDTSCTDFAFKDFHILELNKMEWLRVTIKPVWYGNVAVHSRCGHGAIVYGNIPNIIF